MKEHIMENGDLAIVTKRHLQLSGCIVKILDCSQPAKILVMVLATPGEDNWLYKFPSWFVTFNSLNVVSDPSEVTKMEAEICLKNL